jgi:hypothetical protein
MGSISQRANLENMNRINRKRVQNLKGLLESLDKIELSIEYKIGSHYQYLEFLTRSFRESIDTYHTICKNLVPED